MNELLTLLTAACLGLNVFQAYRDVKNQNYAHLPISVGLVCLMAYFLFR